MSNDRFKFRVWDKQKNSFVDSFEINPDGTFAIFDFRFHEYTIPLSEDDGYIIEQCTGLKDRNGNMIFEGDVIKIVGNVFIPKGVKLEVCYGFISWQLRELDHGGYIDFCCNGSNFEVIGNIHEMEVTKCNLK